MVSCTQKQPIFNSVWEMTDMVNVHPAFKDQYSDTLTDVHFEYYVLIKNVSQTTQTIDSNTFIELVDDKYSKMVPVSVINSEHTPLGPVKISSKMELQIVLRSRNKLSWVYDYDKMKNVMLDPSIKMIKQTKLFYIAQDDTIEINKSKDYFDF